MAERTPFHFSPRPNRAHEIQWRDYGEEAFWAASHQGKPILLAISAVWCHWCHVMDETTYSDADVIRVINESFIPIRVDTDRRPDLNLRYNAGGWPTTAFLTPAGDAIAAGTFMPPDQMKSVLQQVLEFWRQNARQAAAEPAAPEGPVPEAQPKAPTDETLSALVQHIQTQFDRAYGGLGQAPKFTHPDIWEVCLGLLVGAGEGWAAGMAVRTMDAMAGSNLMDRVAGGFFRYSTTREWTIPHFEKLLEDNAQLALLYMHGFQVMGDPAYREVAQRTLDWMGKTLLTPSGGFAASQDADEEYYRLPPEEREKAQAPAIDPTTYAGASGLAVSAHLLGSVLIAPGYRAVGLTALESLFIQLWDPEAGLAHDDAGTLRNWLADLEAVGAACLDAYELTGDGEHLQRARQLLAMMDRDLSDPAGPGYFDMPVREQAVGRLKHRQKPLTANCGAIKLMWRLGRLTGDEALMDRARGWLGAFAPVAERFGLFGMAWAGAYLTIQGPALDAVLVADDNHRPDLLRQAVFAIYDLNRAIRELDVRDPEREARGYQEEPLPVLYLCRGTACAPPVTDANAVADAFRRLITGEGPDDAAAPIAPIV